MNNINNISQSTFTQSTSKKTTSKGNTTIENIYSEIKEETTLVAATYETVEGEGETSNQSGNYTVDIEKIQAMKDESDQRMLELFRDTVKGTGLKQLGGIRSIIEKLENGEKVTLEIEFTAEDVEQAKIDVAEGGYWSAEETSTRLVDFAKAISGGDPSKIELLKDAFKAGFSEIEEMFGGELPELSYDTYDLTMDKFAAWQEEGNTETEVNIDTE